LKPPGQILFKRLMHAQLSDGNAGIQGREWHGSVFVRPNEQRLSDAEMKLSEGTAGHGVK
jgi:hypothetical protein